MTGTDEHRARRARSPIARVWLLTATVALLAATVVFLLRDLPAVMTAPLPIPWWALAVAFAVVEVAVFHLHFRRETHTLSLAEVPLTVGLFLVSPLALIIGQLVGSAFALAFHRRQPAVKLCFNLAQFALATGVGIVVFHAFVDRSDPLGPISWIAALAATSAASCVGSLLVGLAIALVEGDLDRRAHLATLGVALAGSIGTTTIGMFAVSVIDISWQRTWLVAAPVLALVVAYRMYTRERTRSEGLAVLYDAMREVQAAPDFDGSVDVLLRKMCDLVRAETAELYVEPRDEARWLYAANGPDGHERLRPIAGDSDGSALEEALALEHALRVTPTKGPIGLRTHLIAAGHAEMIVAPLRGEGRAFGVVIVADHTSDVGTFGPEHVRMIDTLASHAAVALENGRLESALAEVVATSDRLRHEAHHDPLTGLPNRVLFAERLEAAAGGRRRDDVLHAVLFIDLDDFKAINDSLGHDVGDELLRLAGARLRSCLRPADTAARLGGDEFAVLLEAVDQADAELLARRIVESFAQPFRLKGRSLTVQTSVGIALTDADGPTVQDVLRNADMAMYVAKSSGKGRFAVYASEMQAELAAREELADDLRAAVERGEIGVAYQPLVDLATGEIVGVEAFARWRHPLRGAVPPAVFVPLAERLGLIGAIGERVLRQAANEVAAQRQAGRPLQVSFNCSARELRHGEILDAIRSALELSALEPATLGIEIAQPVALDDLASATPVIPRLRALGVRVVLDEFGSEPLPLDTLHVLPVDAVKVARAYAARAASRDRAGAVAASVYALARSVAPDVIGSGVETPTQADVLREAGCRLAQGYLYGRPAEDLAALLASHGSQSVAAAS